MPGLFFFKNFARQYASAPGCRSGPYTPGSLRFVEPEDPQPRPEIRVPNRLVQATNRRHIPDIPLGWSVIGLMIVLLGCSGFYAWWKRVLRSRCAPPRQRRRRSWLSKPSRPHALIQPDTPPPVEASGVVLKLSATERTWFSISSDGKEIFSGILQPSESKTLTGLDRATMRVGNAGGIDVRWNGKVIAPLGPRGQVLTIRITPEDFEIVPPACTQARTVASLPP